MNAAMLIRVGDKLIGLDCAKGRGITLPGGKVEETETFRQAAIRECLEETGITIEKAKLVFHGSNGKTYCYTYESNMAREIHRYVGMNRGSGVVGIYHYAAFLKSKFAAYYDALFQTLGMIE